MSKAFISIMCVASCSFLAACGSNDPVTDEAVVGSGEANGTVGVYQDGKGQKVGNERIVPTENILNSSDDLLLQNLNFEDFKTMIGPLKGCSFKLKGEQESLIITNAGASGKTKPQALVRLNGKVVMLDAVRTGGYGYLAGGPEFRSGDLGVEIAPDEGPSKRINNSTRLWGASAVVRGKGNTVRVYRGGQYTCDF